MLNPKNHSNWIVALPLRRLDTLVKSDTKRTHYFFDMLV